MTGTLLLALCAFLSAAGAHLLVRARWTWRSPRTAIAVWQSLGLIWGVASIGTLLGFGVAPYGRGVLGGLLVFAADIGSAHHGRPPGLLHTASIAAGLALAAVLIGMLYSAVHTVVRARRRHRALLALVAHGDPDVPGTLVLDHPDAAAYCVPGVRSTVVVSAGTVRLLSPYELAAVLDHERAHARERHDLVLLPFASLHRAFPRLRIITRTLDSVAMLIEMAADDRAGKHRPRMELATALLRFAAARPSPSPAGTLAADGAAPAADGGAPGRVAGGPHGGANPVLARVQRLLKPDPLPRYLRAVMLASAVGTASIPVTLFFIPH